MQVLDHTHLSDHSLVSLCLWTCFTSKDKLNVSSTYAAPFRYQISSEKLNVFKNDISSKDVEGKIQSLKSMMTGEVDPRTLQVACDSITALINSIASKHFKKISPGQDHRPSKNRWFDMECRKAKRQLTKKCKLLSRHPNNSNVRESHFNQRRKYRRLIKRKKQTFLDNPSHKINDGKSISWKDLKQLKKHVCKKQATDDSKINEFKNFYEKLCSDTQLPANHEESSDFANRACSLANTTPSDSHLNQLFSMEELTAALSKLKNGKASSFDHISNEILKSLSKNFYEALLMLFNQCLRNAAYFWNQSILSPIYKKGSKGDPDNYRAIAVCSCIGKLLSIMLLERLTSFRLNKASDPNNQCGFTKGRQCNDHIFTLLTILQKYKKSKKKVHAVFVDLRKAFAWLIDKLNFSNLL